MINVKMYKELYPVGTRIVLEAMGEDPRPVLPGTRGTVRAVDDIGTVHCDFDNGRSLGLIPDVDVFRALSAKELAEERTSLDSQIQSTSALVNRPEIEGTPAAPER